MPRRWPLEALLFLALAAAIGARLGLPPGAGHLLLAAVVLVAATHGLAAGVATGAMASLAALYGQGATPLDVVDLAGNRAALGPAFAHLAFGALAGLAAEGHLRAAARAAAERRELLEQAEDLAVRWTAATEARQELERRLAAEVEPVEAMAAEAAAVRGQPEAALALAQTFLQARVAAYFVPEGGRWRAQAALGTPPPATADGLIVRAAREGRAVAAHQLDPDGAWLAAPVRRADGSLLGVLAIHELPFAKLTPVAVRMLAVLADALGGDQPGVIVDLRRLPEAS
jgi:hypothetical protein